MSNAPGLVIGLHTISKNTKADGNSIDDKHIQVM